MQSRTRATRFRRIIELLMAAKEDAAKSGSLNDSLLLPPPLGAPGVGEGGVGTLGAFRDHCLVLALCVPPSQPSPSEGKE